LTEQERSYLPQSVMALENFGAGAETDFEAVYESGVQVLFSASPLSENDVRQAEALGEALGLPVVCLSSLILDIPDALALLGTMFDADLSAQIYHAYRSLESADAIPEEEKASCCYICGLDPLQALTAGAPQTAVIRLAGGRCVSESAEAVPRASAPETLIAWQPQVIFVAGDRVRALSSAEAAAALLADARFSDIPAVRNGRVHAIPELPLPLFAPDGPNRVAGVLWAEKLLYPERYENMDLSAELLRFYRMYYHLDMNEDDMSLLLSTFNPHVVD